MLKKRATAASHPEKLPLGIICTSCNKNKVECCVIYLRTFYCGQGISQRESFTSYQLNILWLSPACTLSRRTPENNPRRDGGTPHPQQCRLLESLLPTMDAFLKRDLSLEMGSVKFLQGEPPVTGTFRRGTSSVR